MKYIDVNKLKEKIYAEDTVSLAHGSLPEFDQGCHYAFLTVLSFIDSLQQEQQEVDLEEEMRKELRLHYNDDQDVYWWNYLKNSFRHFYELGLNARKEE